MYFLRDDQPKSKAGTPLSDVIYDTVRVIFETVASRC